MGFSNSLVGLSHLESVSVSGGLSESSSLHSEFRRKTSKSQKVPDKKQ